MISGFKEKAMREVQIVTEHMQQEQCLKNLEAKPEATILTFLIKGNLKNRNSMYWDGENRDAYWWRLKKK